MKIITVPDPRLRKKSTKITTVDEEVLQLIEEMIEASLNWEKDHPHEISAAMAAPQIGVNRRLIIIRDDMSDKTNHSFTALINPEVIKVGTKTAVDYEGCLSVPKVYGKVERPTKIKIKAELTNGESVRIKAEDSNARMLLHEIDHLNGVLFIDHVGEHRDGFCELNEQGELVPLDYEQVKNDKNLFPDE